MKRGWIAPLLVALLISGINPDASALRHRAPARTQTRVSTSPHSLHAAMWECLRMSIVEKTIRQLIHNRVHDLN